MNQIPEEIRNILFPEFLMKELSNLENCKEGCQSCCKAQNDGGRLSDLCLHLQFSRVQAKISRTVPEVFAFIKMQQLAHSQWTPKRRTMSDAIHEAFPSLTLPQCVQLVHAWAVYDAKYENPVDKDGLAIRFRYYIDYQTQRGPVSAHVAEYWDRDTLEWKRQGVYFSQIPTGKLTAVRIWKNEAGSCPFCLTTFAAAIRSSTFQEFSQMRNWRRMNNAHSTMEHEREYESAKLEAPRF